MNRKAIFVLLGSLAVASPAVAEPTAEARAELARVQDLYRAVTMYHPLLEGDGVSGERVRAALFDVERYVEELDSRLATDKLFIDDPGTLDAISEIVAKAHMQAALLHAKGVDLESSITHYQKVVDLLGRNPSDWDTTLVRAGRFGPLEGAREIVFERATPKEITKDLRGFWSSGVVTRFRVQEYARDARTRFSLQRIGGPNDPFYESAFEVAARRFQQRVQTGLEEFQVVLPPGHYRVAGAGGDQPRDFVLVRGGVSDPIVLNPNRFS
ncbi:MAG: hypothetical protein D6760_10295, partial [Deltaproteobacteria bacterium]